jgi:hypothetical protein
MCIEKEKKMIQQSFCRDMIVTSVWYKNTINIASTKIKQDIITLCQKVSKNQNTPSQIPIFPSPTCDDMATPTCSTRNRYQLRCRHNYSINKTCRVARKKESAQPPYFLDLPAPMRSGVYGISGPDTMLFQTPVKKKKTSKP